ncbi:hypothetical protein ILP97_44645 [Amycolatopsis sp. H6(2020)]|nr:hypothetical protein [Amycolatopsis sp. H6(2020)]
MTATQTISTKAAAEAIGTTPRQLRVFLRASDKYENVGAGGRYALTSADLGPMKKEFDAWSAAREAAKAAAQEALAKQGQPEPEAKEEPPTAEPEPVKKPATRTRKAPVRKTA